MNEPWHLIGAYLDGALTSTEENELRAWLASDPEHARAFVREAHLHHRLAQEFRASQVFTNFASAVEETPRVSGAEMPDAGASQADDRPVIAFPKPAQRREAGPLRPILAWAASIVFLLSAAIWFFGPRMGEPVLARVQGVGVSIKRGTESIPATIGFRLRPADVLRTGTNSAVTISFGKENTTIELSANTELALTSFTKGKRFQMPVGHLKASVARQRPFQPMIVTTPNARARVIGTQFTLTANTNRTELRVDEGKVRLADMSNAQNPATVPAGYSAVVAAATKLAALPQTGWILREYWTNLTAKLLQTPTSATIFSELPASRTRQEWLDRLETLKGWGENYGARWRGYLHPPVTGRYEIGVTAYDEAFLWLSPDDRADHRVLGMVVQKAHIVQPFELEAGRRYYIEILHKAGVGQGHLSVNWKRPEGKVEAITGAYLSPFKPVPKETKP